MPEVFYSTFLDGTQLIPGEYTNSEINVNGACTVRLMLYTIPPPPPSRRHPSAPHPFAPHKFAGRLDRVLGADFRPVQRSCRATPGRSRMTALR